uniref:Uncharacterized protein n=1 Tax=Arundo donax TaxID=35708 RepID=A0A0A9GIX0_ARUDO
MCLTLHFSSLSSALRIRLEPVVVHVEFIQILLPPPPPRRCFYLSIAG